MTSSNVSAPPLPEVGAPAPDVKLPSSEDRTISLRDYRGEKRVVLVFYPLDFSPVCSLQLPEYSAMLAQFEERDAVVLGISRDSVHTHKAWAREFGIEVPLLADMVGDVATAYGVEIPERRVNRRAVFVIDKRGVLRFAHSEESTGDFSLHASDILEVLERFED